MGPGRGRSRPQCTRSAHPPSLNSAQSTGTHGLRAPPCQPPCACPLLMSSGRPQDSQLSADAWELTHVRVFLSSLSLPCPSPVALRWLLQAPPSPSGWPTTQGTRNVTWTSRRTTSSATMRVPWPCMWRSCPMSKAPPSLGVPVTEVLSPLTLLLWLPLLPLSA